MGSPALHVGQRISSMTDSVTPPGFVYFVVKPIVEIQGLTDLGTSVPLFHYEAVILQQFGTPLRESTPKAKRDFFLGQERVFLANACKDFAVPTRLTEPCALANCHGWVFGGGKFGIGDALVPLVLRENGYNSVEEPNDGDVAVFSGDGEVNHSGIVRKSGRGEMQVESKWGPFGVYLHSLDDHPFRGQAAFYRSTRSGHQLEMRIV
jgi:hypothetical protein